jgi:hypothetical protein
MMLIAGVFSPIWKQREKQILHSAERRFVQDDSYYNQNAGPSTSVAAATSAQDDSY